MDLAGIVREKGADKVADFRWIAKLDVLCKWYCGVVAMVLASLSLGPLVNTYGFRAGYSCEDVASMLTEAVRYAFRWSINLVVFSLDIAIAFDSMLHDRLA